MCPEISTQNAIDSSGNGKLFSVGVDDNGKMMLLRSNCNFILKARVTEGRATLAHNPLAN